MTAPPARPVPAASKPPFILGLALAGCDRCRANLEHEFVYGRDGVVRVRCLACGVVGYEVPLAAASAWMAGVVGA